MQAPTKISGRRAQKTQRPEATSLVKKTYILCLDDSGTRHPTRKVGKTAAHGNDWFSLGGILFDEEVEAEIRSLHATFCSKWKISVPLHSTEIRARADGFAFIGTLDQHSQDIFYEDLYLLMKTIPALGIACVIDRPGYCNRYLQKYEPEKRWLLCKSAFSICVERAAKFAFSNGGNLRVYVERSDKNTDALIHTYYKELKANGMPFASATSSVYSPLKPAALEDVLYEFRLKAKTSPLMQFADLFLWPMCMGGYNPEVRPYKRLLGDGKLIDCVVAKDDVSKLGIKYYCFDNKKPD